MMVRGSPVIDHMGIAVSNLAASRAFYEQALAPLGLRVLYGDERSLAMGTDGADDFALHIGGAMTPGLHVAFVASSKEAVDAFHAAALAAGGRDNGAPGYRPQYHRGYYGAFVFDPDGNNVEAVFHDWKAAQRTAPTNGRGARGGARGDGRGGGRGGGDPTGRRPR
jgi:catechol 2,3-dioxygenase-like lactoylglutathione lyase family enzyme